ncbi:MAG: hypothetical protein CM1200mP29_05100 [Verrucomicrobiota bacterium]|nr:MAG: hypothetical protein CM1200mP29_05100 [Verrucomicrobiota bacterium]
MMPIRGWPWCGMRRLNQPNRLVPGQWGRLGDCCGGQLRDRLWALHLQYTLVAEPYEETEEAGDPMTAGSRLDRSVQCGDREQLSHPIFTTV